MPTVYGDLAGWREYALDRGDSDPTDAADAVANAAHVRGSDYIRTRYGIRMGDDFDPLDENVIEATYIASSLELATPGFWSTTFTPSQAKVLTRVDAIQWQVVDSGITGIDGMRPFSPAIDALLAPLGGLAMPAVMVV